MQYYERRFTGHMPPPAGIEISYRQIALLVYLTLFVATWLFSDYLPEQFFRDQVKLVDSLETDGEGLSSFRATAAAYAWMTFGHPELLIPVFALGHILLLARFTINRSALIASFFIFVPSLFLNLIVLGKETLVIGMSTLIAWSLLTFRALPALLLAVALYLVYGAFVRPYYLAIIGLFLLLLLLYRTGINTRILVGFVGLAVFFLLPAELYSLAAMHREDANNYALFLGSFDIRTMVNNIVVPDNPFEFLANYAYSFIALNFPVLVFHGVRDAVITLTNSFVLFLICRGMLAGNRAQGVLSLLMLSHVLVLCLFEPDVGSYSRHLLSVSIYAAISLSLLPRLRIFS